MLYDGYRGEGKRPACILGLLRKASRTDDIVYYRTDPDLSITDGDILLQGARPLYTEGGGKNWLYCFDFTRENLDDLLGAEVSSGDVLLLLDTHKRTVYCSGQDKSQVQTGDMIEKILENRKMSVQAMTGTVSGKPWRKNWLLFSLMRPGAYEPASCADYVDRQPMPVSVGIIPLPGCIRRTYRQYCPPGTDIR